MCEPPTRGAAAARQSWRERLEGWSAAASSDGSALPGVVYVVVALKLVLYVYVFERWARAAAPLLSEEFFRRFLVYNALGDVLGANATWGPLAFRLKFPVVTWYNLLKPGTFCRPLVPGAPWRRRPWQCVRCSVSLRGDESRRRRRDVDIRRRRVAAAATWTFRGDGSPRPRRGHSEETVAKSARRDLFG